MDQNHLLVLVSGKQGSGKSSLGHELQELLRPNVCVLSHKFATPLYEMHDAVMDVLIGYLPENHEIFKKIHGPLLQMLGTEFGRKHLGENIWVDLLRSDLSLNKVDYYVLVSIVDDCRFPNEFDIDWPDKLTVRLECDRDVRKARCEKWRENENHESEIALDEYARLGKFDIYLDTRAANVDETARIVYQEIQQRIGVA